MIWYKVNDVQTVICYGSRLSNIIIVIIDVVYYSNSLSITIIYCKKIALTFNFEGMTFNHHTTITPL